MPSSPSQKAGGLRRLAGKTIATLDQVLSGVGAVADTVSKVAPGVVDESAKALDAHRAKHKGDFKMPALIDLPLAEAKRVLDHYQLQHALVLLAPAPQYAAARSDVILTTSPKPNAKVAPNTFVRAYYVSAEGVAASKQLVATRQAAKRDAKIANKAARRILAREVGHGLKQLPAKLTKRLGRKDSGLPPEADAASETDQMTQSDRP
ncbi:hypothetical protein ACFQ3L_09350 [Lacticaseibacillus jixianensis]|uniref:PASTA domain-containing protein n=1 Tax=Lacticaseibacillus jixianensis TaxID=2486012 RepID=A0ABW4B9V4_9LACO|nr:hypothetical protein [Lacticaseibacillus jixianensis]